MRLRLQGTALQLCMLSVRPICGEGRAGDLLGAAGWNTTHLHVQFRLQGGPHRFGPGALRGEGGAISGVVVRRTTTVIWANIFVAVDGPTPGILGGGGVTSEVDVRRVTAVAVTCVSCVP